MEKVSAAPKLHCLGQNGQLDDSGETKTPERRVHARPTVCLRVGISGGGDCAG